ncbi:MAG: serine protease [Myxococcales bacterium]|nr:serine protease [Myxococcales bacterium]
MRRIASLAVLALGLLTAACGGSNKEAKAPSGSAKASTSSASSGDAAQGATPNDTAKSSLKRSTVRATIQQGLGMFLQKVSVEDRPVFLGGKFHGYRIAALKGDLASTELKAGDVVTRVNGLPIERPEQALEAFRSLEISSELRIDYERDGEPRALRYAIVED